MDTLKIAAASVADLVDRQFALLVDEHHNMGLPETLVPYGGCGVKGLQMTCSALTELAMQRSFSDTVLSRSTECANQDKVSMGLQAAVHASEIVALLAARARHRADRAVERGEPSRRDETVAGRARAPAQPSGRCRPS